jgi:hypothetical protein
MGPGRRAVLLTLLLAGAVLGTWRLYRASLEALLLRFSRIAGGAGRLSWLVLAIAPCAALAILASSLPPGSLWPEEAWGYDVLEYHLQLPKEYYEAGVISYLPHNVYGSFPAAAEMLYLAAMQVREETIESWATANCLNAMLAALVVMAAWLAGREVSPGVAIVTAVLTATTGWLVYLSGLAFVENGMLFMGMLSAACILRAAPILRGVPELNAAAAMVTRRLALRWLALAGVLAGFACGFKYTAGPLIAAPLLLGVAVVVPRRTGARAAGLAMFAAAAAVTFAPWMIKNAVLTGNPVFPLAGRIFKSCPPGWGEAEAARFAASHLPGPDESSVAARAAAFYHHVLADKSQRFGVVTLALAAIGLARRQRIEASLGIVLFAQVLIWLAATHLYGRFAVPLLIPLLLLAGRATARRDGRVAAAMVPVVLLGATLNTCCMGALYVDNVMPGGTRMNIEGATPVFTFGLHPAHRHLEILNDDRSAVRRTLMVGDARAFYFQRPVDYCVVFNHNPFADAAGEAATVPEIIAWLRERGYSHVYVNWSEVFRLRRSRYGFPDAITPSLFEQLTEAGLLVVARSDEALPDRPLPVWVIYEVPPP